ncbi:MAG: ABC transporter substrate-binding protein [Clostridia bacterium]|nr:ABC transporter substrate-binding protein [Clostridia bacterium]
MFRKLTALLLTLTLSMGILPLSLAEDTQVINVAVTQTLETMNPLQISSTEVSKYAMGLAFYPLVELDRELNFVPQLADSITTEDNLTFTIHLDERACWSDGVPVTAQDVLFTFLIETSPSCVNASMMFYAIEGVSDDNTMPEGATEIPGIQILDDKTLTVTTKWPMALSTFENNFGRYILTVPEHVLKDIPRDQILTDPFFLHPTVVSGPYSIVDFDLNHYVHYQANESFFLGKPNVEYLNLVVTASTQLLAGLQSGEIDLVQQTTADIPMDDYDAVRALSGVTAVSGTPVTNQSIFIDVENVPDVRIRRALLLGMDREMILHELLHDNGEIVDAYLVSSSPYYSEELGVTAYDPDAARALIAEAKADGTDTHLTWHVNAGDSTFVQAVEYFAAAFEELGLQIDIRTVDLSTLMTVADAGEFQIMSVQYTYAPVDPYTDMVWLMSADGWTRYENEAMASALMDTQSLTDIEAITERFLAAQKIVVEDCPMISAYVLSALGAVSNRLVGAVPDVFGTFVNVHEWTVQ